MNKLTNKITQAVETLRGFEVLARLYWLNVMVVRNELTKAEAGYIVINNLI